MLVGLIHMSFTHIKIRNNTHMHIFTSYLSIIYNLHSVIPYSNQAATGERKGQG